MSTAVQFLSTRSYLREPGSGVATLVGDFTGAPLAGSGTQVHPTQVALVVSLRTDIAGRAWRGRIYLPALVASVAMSQAQLDSVALAAADMIAGINQDISGIAGTPWGVAFGPLIEPSPVTSVSLDNLLDTQRRRRNKLAPSARVSEPVPVG